MYISNVQIFSLTMDKQAAFAFYATCSIKSPYFSASPSLRAELSKRISHVCLAHPAPLGRHLSARLRLFDALQMGSRCPISSAPCLSRAPLAGGCCGDGLKQRLSASSRVGRRVDLFTLQHKVLQRLKSEPELEPCTTKVPSQTFQVTNVRLARK